MSRFLYVVYFLYLLPLVTLIFTAFVSNGFQTEAGVVATAAAMSTVFLESLRDGFGVLLIPLTTAYSVRFDVQSGMPGKTRKLLGFLLCSCLTSFMVFGMVAAYQPRILEYGSNTYSVFRTISILYARELLSYVAIVLGMTANGPRVSLRTGDDTSSENIRTNMRQT